MGYYKHTPNAGGPRVQQEGRDGRWRRRDLLLRCSTDDSDRYAVAMRGRMLQTRMEEAESLLHVVTKVYLRNGSRKSGVGS